MTYAEPRWNACCNGNAIRRLDVIHIELVLQETMSMGMRPYDISNPDIGNRNTSPNDICP